MKISFVVQEKSEIGDKDDSIDDELAPFQYALEELRPYVDGEILLELGDEVEVFLDVYPDLVVSFDDVVESIKRVKSGWLGQDYIWFCEQGNNIYLYYEVVGDVVALSCAKGTEASKGKGKRPTPEFRVCVSCSDYVSEWSKVFLSLSGLFELKLGKIIEMPF